MRSARSYAFAAFALVVVITTSASAGPVSPAPPLPAPTGTVVNVSTEAQLQSAVSAMSSNKTIVIAAGTYRLSSTLYVNGTFSNVGIRGATNNPADVVLIGSGMTTASARSRSASGRVGTFKG